MDRVTYDAAWLTSLTFVGWCTIEPARRNAIADATHIAAMATTTSAVVSALCWWALMQARCPDLGGLAFSVKSVPGPVQMSVRPGLSDGNPLCELSCFRRHVAAGTWRRPGGHELQLGYSVTVLPGLTTMNLAILYKPAYLFTAGVWLLARCADLEGLGYSVTAFWACLGVLLGLGAFWRVCAAAAMLTLHRDKCR